MKAAQKEAQLHELNMHTTSLQERSAQQRSQLDNSSAELELALRQASSHRFSVFLPQTVAISPSAAMQQREANQRAEQQLNDLRQQFAHSQVAAPACNTHVNALPRGLHLSPACGAPCPLCYACVLLYQAMRQEKERQLERLQHKLATDVEEDGKRRAREQQMFAEIHKRSPRVQSQLDTKVSKTGCPLPPLPSPSAALFLRCPLPPLPTSSAGPSSTAPPLPAASLALNMALSKSSTRPADELEP